ncbi:UNVERIFIED_CONTAM: hypothetical protein GTU68_063100, partial [Idotea baltica]|nr:hypothetical protein [Idotea baltica]
VVAYECENNWKIKGKVRRHCQENGTWSGEYPECIEVLCTSLSQELEKRYRDIDERDIEPWNKELLEKRKEEKKLRIRAEDGDRSVGSTMHYKCSEGQKVVGEETRLCKQHGVWDGAEPKCEWVYCEKPSDIPNGRVHLVNNDLIFGSVVEYFCLPKYFLRGPFNRTCTSNGTWSGINPQCNLDDTDYGVFEDNTVDGTSNLARGPLDESLEGASYTGIYVGVAVSFFLVLGVGLTLLFFKTRENKMAKSSSVRPLPPAKPLEPPPLPPVMTYGDLNDPTTGNNIYEHIPEDMDNASYTNMSPTNSFSSTPPNSYSNYPESHTYSNTGREVQYANSNASSIPYGNGSSNGKVPPHMSRRPRMPPPQPPQVPVTPSAAGVTVNGVRLNNGS